MSAHQFANDWTEAQFMIPDPGSGKALPSHQTGIVPIVTGASAETNTLAAPVKEGIELTLAMRTDGGGNRTITVAHAYDAAGSTTIILTTVGDTVTLKSIPYGSGFRWRSVGVASAGNVRLEDQLGLTDRTNVEHVIADILTNLYHVSGGFVDLPLNGWREVSSDNDVANAAGNGGILASDTTPIARGNADGGMELYWATGDVDAIGCSVALPADLDTTANLLLDLMCVGGTTNAPSFTVATNFDRGSAVSDTAAGTAVAGLQTATATIAAADVPLGASALTIRLTPGTHAADAFLLSAARLRYTRRLS